MEESHRKKLSEETTCRLYDNDEESFNHLWLCCPAFDADYQRLDLGASLDELICLSEEVQALLGIPTGVKGEVQQEQHHSAFCRW